VTDCFVHASDLHLDARLGDLGPIEPSDRQRLATLAAEAWDQLVQTTIDREASFLVLAGDIFHSGAAQFGVQRVFHEGLERLGQVGPNGIKVFVCHGNHDPLADDFTRIGQPLDNVVVFQSGTPQTHTVTLNSGSEAHVSGLSFSKTHEPDNLAVRFKDLNPGPGPHVAVLHADLGGNKDHLPYAPCSLDDLKESFVDYWALGHIHLRSVTKIGPDRYAAYCGNLQGRSLKTSERHPKGVLVVPIDKDHIGEPEFVACDKVRFTESEVEVEPDDEVWNVLDRLHEAAASARASAEDRAVVLSVVLTGHHPDPETIRRIVENEDGILDDLPTHLNDGGLAKIQSQVKRHLGSRGLPSGGFGAQALESLRSDDTRSVLEELVSAMPSAIGPSLLPADEGGRRPTHAELVDELFEDVRSSAEDLLLKYLVDGDA
jgi:exonuclease SbcD|tara:strand:- start:1088 stop:2380 length:1293 start_codon:yes stop_codon:yes gene_type:complete